jgi:GrpB-like predicted nucleotidyltransferase (UPF0157 family)
VEPDLRPADEVIDAARAILRHERTRLATLLADHELVLVGGSSVPGALTKGDVDLHLRIPAATFGSTVAVLRVVYRIVHPEIWQPTLATFAVDAALPTGVAVTPVGSEHDLRFSRSWQLLAADPDLLHAYNDVKGRHGPEDAEYEQSKSAFFDLLMELWPEHPAGGRRRPGPAPAEASP